VSDRSLYSMRSFILSQCRDLRMGVIWEDLGALTTVRARHDMARQSVLVTSSGDQRRLTAMYGRQPVMTSTLIYPRGPQVGRVHQSGAVPWQHLKARMASLYWTLTGTLSQCSWRRGGVMWSNFHHENTIIRIDVQHF